MAVFTDFSSAQVAAQDPSTTAQDLMDIAYAYPELGVLIARHPNAYDDLLDWLDQYGSMEVRSAVATRRASLQPLALPTDEPMDETVLGTPGSWNAAAEPASASYQSPYAAPQSGWDTPPVPVDASPWATPAPNDPSTSSVFAADTLAAWGTPPAPPDPTAYSAATSYSSASDVSAVPLTDSGAYTGMVGQSLEPSNVELGLAPNSSGQYGAATPPAPVYPDATGMAAAVPGQMVQTPYGAKQVSSKSKTAAGVLGIFLGSIGVGRFYRGYVGLGIVQIIVSAVTLGIGAIWGPIEGIITLVARPGSPYSLDSEGKLMV